MLKGNARRFLLLVLLPAQELLACDQRDQQREHGEQTLLQMQWRETQLGGTLAIHPEAPPTLGFISLRAFVVALHYSGCCSLHASFFCM